MESISKYNLNGIEYVKLSELNDLIKAMKRKCIDGAEPGYICEEMGERRAAMLSLNHLEAVLNKEKAKQRMHERLEKEKTQREAHEEDEPAGSWMVYKAGSKPREFWYFMEWRKGKPVIGQCDGMVFTYEGMAQHVSEKLGEGWKVIDISQEAYKKAERLMAAIFAEPQKEDA